MRKLLGEAVTGQLEGFKLKKADILLEHTRAGLWGRLIRFATGNFWNHALIVCEVSDKNRGSDKTLIIDPRMGGVYVVDIADFLKGLKNYDIAVKRVETKWFQDGDDAGGLNYPGLVADRALLETENKYDSLFLFGPVRRLLRRIIIGYRFVSKSKRYPRWRKRHPTKVVGPLNNYTYFCSGFVQWSYYQGIAKAVEEGKLGSSRLKDVVFDSRLSWEVDEHDLLSVTPADLAGSNKLSWKYIIKDGTAWEVSSEAEVNSILRSGKS